MSIALAPGFADPVFDAQAVFRSVLSALARPGHFRELPLWLDPPAPMTPELGAVALAFADPDAPLWLDAPLGASSAVSAYLGFHTGARLVTDPAEAAFAFVSDPARLPSFTAFAQGTDEYPDRSATIVIAVGSFAKGPAIRLEGPGIRGRVTTSASPLPADFADRLRANRMRFPRGIDCLLVCAGQVLGIPRSASATETA